MLPLLALALAADPVVLKVVVIDVSAPDAVYEDISRALTEQVVGELRSAGLEAVRVDENALPEEGCRIGPCLGVVAREQKAQVVVILDATEVDKSHTQVSVAAMAGRNGMPLTAGRYKAKNGGKPPKELTTFIAQLAKKLSPAVAAGTAADAGAPKPAK